MKRRKKMSSLDLLKSYTVEKPQPLIGAKTIQILMMREILDYTVLRTEETRELNTVATPLSLKNGDVTTMRVAFLATKQKAAESRKLEQMLRTATEDARMDITECFLKDNLCLECPRCALFGATSTESGRQNRANIKHRIAYSTAFSLLPFEEIESSTTFNAINDRNQTTGQALGTRYAVVPATVFPSIVSLRSVTLTEFVLSIKTLLACKSYGAESRIGGDVRNSVFGIIGGWEEVITPLELTLELYEQQDNLSGETFKTIAEKYRPMTGNPDHITIFSPEQVDQVIKEATEIPLDKSLLEQSYKDVGEYVSEQQKK
ncbi:type I-D CRISPR-associated protein Cas7/Csc2 [Candidatus Poribacteria bacterium]|nr:type I-D CRISPR-associated protein Cas7/Csc2 [Candidatus Poribacteria bacterium]